VFAAGRFIVRLMKIPLTYGFVLALGGALLLIALYLAGFYDNGEKLNVGQWIDGCVGLVIAITCLALAMREKRAAAPAGTEWGYGSAFGAGVLTALFAAIFAGFFGYLYFAVINPNMSEVLYQAQVAKLEAKGLPPARLEDAEKMMQRFFTPAVLTCFRVLGTFVWTLLLSLVVAIFFRKPAQPEGSLAASLPPTMS